MNNLIKHNKKMLDLKLTTLGTEYDFIDGSVAITFEGYSDTKGAVIKEVVKRKGKPILGIGDSLYNDKFLHEVEKNNGEVIIISKVDPELSWKIVDSWTKNYDNQRN